MSNVAYATTLDVRDTCLCLHVQRAARALARRFDEALRPVGLTHGQFSMMNALNRPRPATMPQLVSVLGMDRTTLTAALKVLEQRALVRIAVSKTDARARELSLTAKGHTTLARALPVWTETHALLEAALSPSEPARLRKTLARF
ncbi:MAG: MarR family transcriptional regulator [Polyangia bacterium]